MLLEDIFSELRDRVSMLDTARFYGLNVNRSGMACCPFHEDETPSLKIYHDHYYCFGCHATGDCTDFAARLFEIPQLEAAKRISYDFGLNLFENGINLPIQVKANPEAEYRRWLTQTSSTITKYMNKLHEWRNRYQLSNQAETLHPLFAESLQRTSYIEYLDEILRYGSEQEKRKLFEQNRMEIQKITDRVHRIAADEHTVRRRAI